MKFPTKLYDSTHLTLGMLLQYVGKLKIQILCKYSADMEENANKLHFKCINFNSSPLCMLSVFMCFYKNLVLVAECHVDCWQTLRWRLLWRICGVTNWSQNKQVKEQWHGKFYLHLIWGKFAILNTENIKICRWITKLEATKMQFICIFFHICWIFAKSWIFYFPR